MAFREDAIQATEDIIDALGDSCVYIPVNGVQTTITAKVDVDGSFGFETEEGMYIVMQGRIEAKTSDMPNAVEGDVIQVNIGDADNPNNQNYALVNPEIDGMGRTFSWLQIA